MNLTKRCVILLALMLAAMVIVPMVSAAEIPRATNNGVTDEIHLTKLMDNPQSITRAYPTIQNQDAVIKSLEGKNITVAEFYETLYPGVMSKLPQKVQPLYKNTKMIWPAYTVSPKKLSPQEASSLVLSLKKTTPSGNNDADSSLHATAAATSSDLSINGLSIVVKGRITLYQSTTGVYPPVSMIYLSTKSMLWQYQRESGFQNIAEKLSVGTLTLIVLLTIFTI